VLKNAAVEKLGNEQVAASIELLWDLYVIFDCIYYDNDSVAVKSFFTFIIID